MDRDQFLQQITQRYVAGKALEGASADEIAKGVVDPVEQMNYVAGLGKKQGDGSSAGSGAGGVLLLVLLFATLVISGLLQMLRL